jgi:hypothetical protein
MVLHEITLASSSLSTDNLYWLTSLAAGWKKKLTDTGSVILNLADVFTPGAPAVSLYQERLLIRLCDELGYTLAQKFYWENSSKMPGPAEWVCVRRIRVTPSIEQVYWLHKQSCNREGQQQTHPPILLSKYAAAHCSRRRTPPQTFKRSSTETGCLRRRQRRQHSSQPHHCAQH